MMRQHCDLCDAVIDPRATRWQFVVRDHEASTRRGLPAGAQWTVECCERCCGLLSRPIIEEVARG